MFTEITKQINSAVIHCMRKIINKNVKKIKNNKLKGNNLSKKLYSLIIIR